MEMYFFVRLAAQQPFLVMLMFLILLFDGIVFYSIMWGNVSVIRDAMDLVRRRLTLHAAQTKSDRQLARRLARSIACVAVRVGEFRQMERNSTLLYLDYVVSNTISLLIGF